MIHSHCLIWANRLIRFPNQLQTLSFKVRLFFAITLYPSTSPVPLPVRPSLAHFLWPLNTSLRLLEHFLKDHDDFQTSPLPPIYYAETGKRATGQQKHKITAEKTWVRFKNTLILHQTHTETCLNIGKTPPFLFRESTTRGPVLVIRSFCNKI